MNDDNQLITLQKLYSQANYSKIVEYAEENRNSLNNNWFIYTIIGMAYFYENKYKESIKHQNKSIQLKATPLNTHNLGIILGQTGNTQEAIKVFNKCIKLGIDEPPIFTNIIDFCLKFNFTDDALKVANLMKDSFPNDHHSYFNIGLVYEKLQDFPKAIQFYEDSLKINTSYALAMNNLGNCYSSLRRVDLAEKKYREAVMIDTKNIKILYNYIAFLIRMGRNKEAQKRIKDGIQINKNFTLLYTALTQTKKFSKDDLDLKLMESILKENNLDPLSKSELLFALSKAYEDIKDYKSSAKSMLQANNLKFKQLKFDNDLTFGTFEKIINFYDNKYYQKHKNEGYKDSQSIFIIGMPRCGSSLIEQILSSHSKMRGLGELLNFSNEMFNLGIGKSDIGELENVDLSFFNQLGENYINSINSEYKINDLFIDKALIFDKIGFIKLALPNSKIIHCKRNRYDQILSIYKNKFEKDYHAYAYNDELLNEYYDYYEKLMKHWEKILADDLITINYEDIIENPKTEIAKILKFIGVDWEESCLKFYQKERYVNTISSSQVKKPLYKGSINSWKNYENYLPNLFEK